MSQDDEPGKSKRRVGKGPRGSYGDQCEKESVYGAREVASPVDGDLGGDIFLMITDRVQRPEATADGVHAAFWRESRVVAVPGEAGRKPVMI